MKIVFVIIVIPFLLTLPEVLSQLQITDEQCQAFMNDDFCPADQLLVVGSNGNSKEIMCVPDNLNPNQEFVWFMNSTNGTNTRLINSDKYEITRDTMNVKLLINDITLQDLGIYYCQGFLNDEPSSGPLRGNCLRVYSPAQFLTCPGNNQISQRGCSDVEVINETAGGTITFDVSVVNDPISGSCYNQSIESVAIRRVGLDDNDVLCRTSECANMTSRFHYSRAEEDGSFVINITLSDVQPSDSGSYTAVAALREPSQNMRVCIHKNFTVNITEQMVTSSSPGPTSTSTSQGPSNALPNEILATILTVIILLVVLLVVLVSVVISLCLWTWRKRDKEQDEKELESFNNSDLYETVDKTKKKANGNHIQPDNISKRHSTISVNEAVEGLDENLNSTDNGHV